MGGRWRRVFGRSAAEDAIDDEIRAHLDQRTADLVRQGVDPVEARRRARIEFGPIEAYREASREEGRTRVDRWLTMISNMRSMTTLRFLLRQRAYVALNVATLVLAVGVNLVVFTIVNALWLRPRPVKEPDRVVMVMGDTESSGASESFWFAEHGLQQQVRDVSAFSLVAGQVMTSGVNAPLTPRITFDAVSHPIETLGVTSEYFGVLGLAIRGRDFVRDDDRYSAEAVGIISERLWRSAFHASQEVIGRTLPASPIPIRIIGIAPSGFQGARLGEQADLWIPRNLVARVSSITKLPNGAPAEDEGVAPMLAIARLQTGVSVAEAQRLLDAHAKNIRWRLAVVPLQAIFGAPDHRTLLINEGPVLRVVTTTAMLVLIGGCATLMALLLVHYERRRREFAVRLALGASRGRLVRRLGAELAWLVGIGCAGALLVAGWSVRAVPALDLPSGVNLGRLDLGIDWRVVLAAFGATSLATIVAASLPLVRFTRVAVARDLISATGTAPAESLRLRKVMLGVHVMATIVTLVAAGLFVRTVAYGLGPGAGFSADRTIFATVPLSSPFDFNAQLRSAQAHGETYTAALAKQISAQLADKRRAAGRRVLTALAGLPGVDVMAFGGAPISVEAAADVVNPRFVAVGGKELRLRAGSLYVGVDYARALGLRIVEGRWLESADAQPPGSPSAAVISASMAAVLWPQQTAIGRHLRFGFDTPGTDHEVVGVVADFAYGSMRFDQPAVVLMAAPDSMLAMNMLSVAIRTEDPYALVEPLRRSLAAQMSDAPPASIATARDLIAADLGRERLGAWLFSGFGLVALVLGVGGVFGLVAYLAESRKREFGVRVALGATPSDLRRLSLGVGLLPVAIGAALGLVAAQWVARAAESQLVGVGRLDPTSYVTAAVLVLTSAAGAALVAARRVHRLSPMDALRSE